MKLINKILNKCGYYKKEKYQKPEIKKETITPIVLRFTDEAKSFLPETNSEAIEINQGIKRNVENSAYFYIFEEIKPFIEIRWNENRMLAELTFYHLKK